MICFIAANRFCSTIRELPAAKILKIPTRSNLDVGIFAFFVSWLVAETADGEALGLGIGVP